MYTTVLHNLRFLADFVDEVNCDSFDVMRAAEKGNHSNKCYWFALENYY